MKNSDLVFCCPHCDGAIFVAAKDINCKIFRHAVYKKTHKIINPHESKRKCQELLKRGKIWGCAKPFKLIKKQGKWIPVICDYI